MITYCLDGRKIESNISVQELKLRMDKVFRDALRSNDPKFISQWTTKSKIKWLALQGEAMLLLEQVNELSGI